jgi:transposase/CheY-like chemotaxis protein
MEVEMFQDDQTLQNQLFAMSYRDLVSADSDTWLYVDLFQALDLSEFDNDYETQGQAAKEPRLMLRTLFYGLTHGVVTGRKLQDACRNDNRFIVLSGNLRPDRRTLDRFLVRHHKRFKDLFVQVVHLAQSMGLVSLGQVAIDGSKFKGQAGPSMKYSMMNKAIREIEGNLLVLQRSLREDNAAEPNNRDQLDKEIADQTVRREKIVKAKAKIEEDFKKRKRQTPRIIENARRSLSDVEASPMVTAKGFFFGYNVQAAVDEKHQIVVAQEVHDHAPDSKALPDLVDQVEENCGEHADMYMADAGYQSITNIKKIQETGATPIIARSATKQKEEKEGNEQVTKEQDQYVCMAKRNLPVSYQGKGHITFRMEKNFCDGCEFTDRCKLYNKKTPVILEDQDREIYVQYLKETRTESWKKKYQRRQVIVEPVFGNIKNKGIRILTRGKRSVQRWWSMATTAHNIEKIIQHMHLIPQT